MGMNLGGMFSSIGQGITGMAMGMYGKREAQKAEKQALKRLDEQLSNAQLEQERQEERIMEFYGLTDEEKDREKRMYEMEKLYGDKVGSESGMTGEQLFGAEGDVNSALLSTILESARNPGGNFEDTLGAQLELARQSINEEAMRTGRFGGLPEGGIRFENLGRAGAELAIRGAEARQAARQQDLENSSALATQILNLGLNADDRQSTFLNSLQNLSSGARARQAEGALAGGQLGASFLLPAQQDMRTAIGDIFGSKIARGYAIEAAGGQTVQQSGNNMASMFQGGGSSIGGGIGGGGGGSSNQTFTGQQFGSNISLGGRAGRNYA